ncbi:hypothetical protein LINGRAHAP2_LOCUS19109 [Linum grandiflorum]
MALPSVLATGSHMDLLRKSEKEVLEIIESAVTLADLRWPEELHRLLKPLFTKQPDSVEDDGHMPSAVSDREAEKINPPKRRNVIRIQLRKDQDSSNLLKPDGKARTATVARYSPPPKPAQETEEDRRKHRDSFNFHKPTTTVVRKAKLEEDEYEKKLENSTRKMREGYNQYTDSRKRSKITHYIPPKSNHDQLPNQKKSKLLTTTRRR